MRDLFTRFNSIWQALDNVGDGQFASLLEKAVKTKLNPARYGDLPRWHDALSQLPELEPAQVKLNESAISVGSTLTDIDRHHVTEQLQQLHPWRKGPFSLHGINIDTEWRSDWKWDRLADHIRLDGHTVLDVGCGSGYHCWRMAGAGAKLALGIDPTISAVMQYLAVQHFIQDPRVGVLPLALEDMPQDAEFQFDTVFSMGVLYHRRSPLDHLTELRRWLKRKGQLVLETLIVDQPGQNILMPKGRYAQMRNVWFLPSTDLLCLWLERSGFEDVELVNINRTSIEEQRSTDWMRFHSLKEFLDPIDPLKTVEGYPAPLRATLVAKRKP